MGKKHKKHKRQGNSRSPSASTEGVFFRDEEPQSSTVSGVQMKVILKLSSTAQKTPQQTCSVSPLKALVVSIPRVCLRPRTPSSIEVQSMEAPGKQITSSSLKVESKHHKARKHKKHRKHSSHETSFQTPVHQATPIDSPISHSSFQATLPQSQVGVYHQGGGVRSGKHMANMISEHKPDSPTLKFTFSKRMMEQEDEQEEENEGSSHTPIPPSSYREKKSHKHKKKHSHRHHSSHASSMDSEEVIGGLVNPNPLSVLSSGSGKNFGNPPWLSEGVVGGAGSLSTQQSHDSVVGFSQGSPTVSVQDLSHDTSHEMDVQVADGDSPNTIHLGGGGEQTSHGRSHKKKKDKKKKHKHKREVSPVLPLQSSLPPGSAVATPSSYHNPAPSFLTGPSLHSSILSSAQEKISQKRRRISEDVVPSPPTAKKLRQSSPATEHVSLSDHALPQTAATNPESQPVPLRKKLSPATIPGSFTILPPKPSPLIPTSRSPFKTPTPPLKDSPVVPKKIWKDMPERSADVVHSTITTSTSISNKAPDPSPPTATPTVSPPPTVKLSSYTLKCFLKNIHHLIQKRDPEGIFAEPVTDDIAPGYSAIISNPMDLTTIATKVEAAMYTSLQDFKADFVLMCNNAMTYNAPETVYYGTAKRLLSSGLQIIAKEASVRPDIKHGRVHTDNPGAPLTSGSVLPVLPTQTEFSIPPPSKATIDYDSAFLCSVPLQRLKPHPHTHYEVGGIPEIAAGVSVEMQQSVADQRHLTRVVVGVEEEEEEEEEVDGTGSHDSRASSVDELLQQVESSASLMRENLDGNKPTARYCFLNQDSSGKTMLNILNPHSSKVDHSKPVDLTVLHDRVRMGQNAATVLATELPMMRATPVSYLMYGAFGSFAPVYDSAFATLTKMDSDLLLSSYGSELGISYAHSLQNFVRGAGGFVSEMATAVLNGLTNNRHSSFVQKLNAFEDKESKKPRPTANKETPEEVASGKELTVKKEEGNDKESFSNDEVKADDDCDSGRAEESSRDNADESSQSKESRSREVSLERSSVSDTTSTQLKCAELELKRSGSIQSGLESNSRESSLGRSTSREASVERNRSRDSSMGQSMRLEEDGGSSGSKDSSKSREVSVESPDGTPPEEASGKEQDSGDATMETESAYSVDAKLQETSSLLLELKSKQEERLSQPPSISPTSGHLLLKPPGQDEVGMANEIQQTLASLTAMVTPEDVVSVDALHSAMGVSVSPLESSSWHTSSTETGVSATAGLPSPPSPRSDEDS